MTHHAVLGTLTARKHGIPQQTFATKLVQLTDFANHPETFNPLEQAILHFAEAFATNPKRWSNDDCTRLKRLLHEDNARRYNEDTRWLMQLDAARAARRSAWARNDLTHLEQRCAEASLNATPELPTELNERMVNAELVELAFLCLQFIALTDVFTALNVPDKCFCPMS